MAVREVTVNEAGEGHSRGEVFNIGKGHVEVLNTGEGQGEVLNTGEGERFAAVEVAEGSAATEVEIFLHHLRFVYHD